MRGRCIPPSLSRCVHKFGGEVNVCRLRCILNKQYYIKAFRPGACRANVPCQRLPGQTCIVRLAIDFDRCYFGQQGSTGHRSANYQIRYDSVSTVALMRISLPAPARTFGSDRT